MTQSPVLISTNCVPAPKAAETARKAGVRALILTHYVPPQPTPRLEQWRDLVTPIFGGTVVLGDDLTSYDVP